MDRMKCLLQVVDDDAKPLGTAGRIMPPRRILALLSIAGAALALALSAESGTSNPGPPLPELTVSVDARHPGRAVTPRYLGLSFELSSAGVLASLADRGDLVGLLRSLGPGVLRLGGASADTRVAWTDSRTPVPSWASAVLDRHVLRGIARLAARSNWRVLLTLGLVHFDPRAAAREAAAARSILGRWLAGIEIGNEPDSYARHALRPAPWTPARYEAEVSAYRHAIARSAPGTPLAGPGVSGSRAFQRWGPAEARRQRPILLTGHHYPLRCDAVPAPSIEDLLSGQTRALEERSLGRFLSVSRKRAIGFRMDETNTVSCGGTPGISNTFAAALWAVGYIGRALAAGAVGVNLQGNPANCLGYSPLCAASPEQLSRGALRAQPQWYGLLLLSKLQGSRPLATHLLGSEPADISVTALRARDGGLRFAIADDEPVDAGPTLVRLMVGPGFDTGTVLTLAARSPAAVSGVTLGGRAVAGDGGWHPPPSLPRVPVSSGVLAVELTPARAVLVTVAPRRRVSLHGRSTSIHS
jgi:hypothetical protein